jgi:hypothetical protein
MSNLEKDLFKKALEDAKALVLANRKPISLSESECVPPDTLMEDEAPESAPDTPESADDKSPIEADGENLENTDLFVPTPNTLSEIDIYNFIDLLNKFRSSPSFTEGVVRDEFGKYWESLQEPIRHIAYTTMLGFTEVAIKGVDANQATHPSDLNLRGASGEQQLTTPAQGAEPADRAGEAIDTQALAPIVVGESHQIVSRKEALKRELKKKIFS